MPIYDIEFRPSAAKSFHKLGTADQRQISRKLKERSENPRVPADRLRDIPDTYKIKLRSSGLRVVYQVRDGQLIVLVLAVGPRSRGKVYRDAIQEFLNLDD